MPKSSRANWTPRSRSRHKVAATSATSLTIAVSVTSRHRRWAGSPLSSRAAVTSSGNDSSRSWTGDTLTESSRSSLSAVVQSTARRQALRSTQRPRSTTMPVDSARAMNRSGGTWPSSSSYHRARVSTPTVAPSERSRTGWKCTSRRCPAIAARSRSAIMGASESAMPVRRVVAAGACARTRTDTSRAGARMATVSAEPLRSRSETGEAGPERVRGGGGHRRAPRQSRVCRGAGPA